MAERVAYQAGCDVNNLDHAVVGHSRRTDDAQRANDHTIDLIGGADDRKILKRHDLALTSPC